MSEFTYNVNGLVSDSEATFATVQRAFAEAMARPPTAADEVRALAAVAEAEGKPCVLPDELIARLEAEARAVLASVEPRHAEYERHMDWTRDEPIVHVPRAVDGELVWVVMRKSDWRPRATRKPSGWAIEGGWLDEAVPELTRGVPNAGGVSPMLPGSESAESVAAMERRYGPGPVYTPLTLRDSALDAAGVVDLLRLRGGILEWQLVEQNVNCSVTWARQGEWHGVRAMARLDTASALSDPSRGWCAGLLGLSDDDGDRRAFAGTSGDWAAMQRAHARVMRETDAQWALERAEIVAARMESER